MARKVLCSFMYGDREISATYRTLANKQPTVIRAHIEFLEM